MRDKKKDGGEFDDGSYVIEDTGDSIEDIEHEMEAVAQEADDTLNRRPPSPPSAAIDDDVKKINDRYLRTLADFENYRKRADREKGEYYKQALAGLMKDLLPVLDNFDRALDHAEQGDDFHRGVFLIYKQLFDGLQKYGLKPFGEKGVPFDPNVHEAVVTEQDPSLPHHTVKDVLQKGYLLQDKLLRPALVKVAVGGPEKRDGVQ